MKTDSFGVQLTCLLSEALHSWGMGWVVGGSRSEPNGLCKVHLGRNESSTALGRQMGHSKYVV